MVVVFLSLIVVIWVASFFKIFFRATSISRATILDDGKKNVMFVIAHPDDESMFFSPTINYFTSTACNLHILCFSTGNADGMGSIRDQELHRACAVLKVPLQQLKILDHPNLQDGFGQLWSHDLLTEIIEEEVTNHYIHTIITFDNYGVSGHCNHRDVHRGVLKFLQTNSGRNVKAWELVSLNIFRKYCGPVDIWLSILSAKRHPSKVIIINKQPWKSFKAMAQHLSQWVWFRKLFVLFSSYTYVNTLDRINPESNELL
ncbi:N-acetylglucosaminyl phosphatidylinositol deacetylase-related [Arabidopsis thaliana x Arabidopsis arenosa]|uniref:N-acetylglucosaminylphosphatidylinositol deacetylase n=3 Tax=Arabidopsis TaxID=3701 RepID=A0A178W1V6_ARATH|nr:N-acetylglucosaminyl phosphatidylinositol deacetylase-related [Arabidopsis thaliana x Arabidopsis arenosa]KAG7637642.1 N-acetylglucosaminyl phosphatidylinositol deacetylase-related [Arabidopsis thaliana x Arabidopsis arenosa]OAP11525.1 hypothetical protein AXX17_AT2G23300 [Arabidopsis thaliana]CAD5319654.1 unnamed protein product [Arabidopsis thaliana]